MFPLINSNNSPNSSNKVKPLCSHKVELIFKDNKVNNRNNSLVDKIHLSNSLKVLTPKIWEINLDSCPSNSNKETNFKIVIIIIPSNNNSSSNFKDSSSSNNFKAKPEVLPIYLIKEVCLKSGEEIESNNKFTLLTPNNNNNNNNNICFNSSNSRRMDSKDNNNKECLLIWETTK